VITYLSYMVAFARFISNLWMYVYVGAIIALTVWIVWSDLNRGARNEVL
jgi:hypothetical protein